jgi:hypothetical protein
VSSEAPSKPVRIYKQVLSFLTLGYQKLNTGEAKLLSADMSFNTSRPAVHLDNFEHITNINCDKGEIIVDFVDQKYSILAYKEWSRHKKLAVMVGWERQCQGTEVGTFDVKHMKLSGRSLTMSKLTPLRRIDIVTDWNLKVNQYGVVQNSSKIHIVPVKSKQGHPPARQHQRRGVLNDTQAAVASFGQWLKTSVIEEVSDVKNTIQNEMNRMSRFGLWNKNSTKNYEITANYDKATDKVVRPQINIYDFLQASLTCYDCYTIGKLDVTIEMRGQLAKIDYYKITMAGNIKSNVEMNIIFRQLREVSLPNVYQKPLFKTLFELSILPANIPGVFALVPLFRFEAGLTEGVIGELAMRVGFDFDFPLDMEIESKNGMFSVPTVRKLSDKKPVTNVHRIRDATTAGRTWIALMIRPQICWGFSVIPEHYGTNNFKPGLFMSLYIENALGIQLTVGSWTHCPAESMNLELYQDHQFTFIIVTPLLWKLFRFWRYKESLTCWFCDRNCGIAVTPSLPFNNTAKHPLANNLTEGINVLHT